MVDSSPTVAETSLDVNVVAVKVAGGGAVVGVVLPPGAGGGVVVVVGAGGAGGDVVVVVGAGAGDDEVVGDAPDEPAATPPGPKSLMSALYELGFSDELSCEGLESK